jgi:hypothetical protein
MESKVSPIDPFNSTKNIIYIPFSNISTESIVNFGIEIYKSPNPNDSLIEVNKIKYLDYIMIIYNLINYIAYSSNKAYSNIKKLRNLVRILHFYCMFLHSYDINKISSSIKNLEKQLTIPLQIKFNKNAEEIINKYPIFVYSDDSGEKNELFKSYMKPIQEYLLKTINNYLGFAESVQTKCYMSLNQNKLEIKDPILKT